MLYQITVSDLYHEYSAGVRKFHQAQLENANFKKAVFRQIDLKQAKLDFANLQQADLSHGDFQESSLIEVNFSRANLSGADFSNTNFSQANLTGANLYRANFSQANLARANLSLIKFIPESSFYSKNSASLDRVNYTVVNFSRAILSGAFFIGVDLTRANLDGAVYDDRTNFPANFNPESKGMIHLKMMQEFASDKLLSQFNRVYSRSNRYLGKIFAERYFNSSRPKSSWLNKFKIDKSNRIVFEGTIASFVTPQQLELFQSWLDSFITSCSSIIKDFNKLI